MKLAKKTVGIAVTGSFCTFSKVFPQVKALVDEGAKVIPILSEISYSTDTRFGTAAENIRFLEETTGEKVIGRIQDAEPIGPKKILDVLIYLLFLIMEEYLSDICFLYIMYLCLLNQCSI